MRGLLLLVTLAVALPVAGCVDAQPVQTAQNESADTQSSSHHIITATDANFQSQVLASPQLVLVDVWASWCGPCRRLAPVIDELAVAYDGRVTVAKVNADENGGVLGRYDIEALPTILFFRDGQLLEQVKGYHTRRELAAKLDALLASSE